MNITSGETGEEYYIVYSDGETQYTEDGSAQIKLKADETATIYGLSTSDKYTIIEHDYENEGYTTSFEIKDTKGEVEKSATGEHVYSTTETTLRKDDDGKLMDANVTFNNAKEAITPTGIAMTFAPYIAMVAFAGVFAVMFLRKKREDF